MLPEPAIFIIDQRFKVTWRNIFDCYRITPDAVSIGEAPERRTILRHDHSCGIDFMQR
jgi:hypothetical protein